MNRSTFPEKKDSFIEHTDITSADKPKIARYKQLIIKTELTSSEQNELEQLQQSLRSKIGTFEDINKIQDAIIAIEEHQLNNVDGYVKGKQNEMNTYVDNKKSEVNTYTDSKKSEFVSYVNTKKDEINSEQSKTINTIESKKQEVKQYADTRKNEMITTKNDFTSYVDNQTRNLNTNMDNTIDTITDKKRYFTNYVDTKEDEVRTLVQDFDSNTARYYTSWTAKARQLEFNIFQGSNKIPTDANLNIKEENIDLIINGVIQTPYFDYTILNNGDFDTIMLSSNARALIQDGTEVVAKWYKNVGKLYFHHASTHEKGGSDEITVNEEMMDNETRNKLVTVGKIAPINPRENQIWIDLN